MHSLGVSSFKLKTSVSGFTLLETMVVLALMSLVVHWALPSWSAVTARLHVELSRNALMNDLHTARVQALQLRTALKLVRLQGCTWSTPASNDWSCGWQLVRKDNQNVLRSQALHAPIQIMLANGSELSIGARGDLGNVGARWNVRNASPNPELQYVVCLNNAGRIRSQAGVSCS